MPIDPNNKHPSFSNLLEHGFIDKIRMPGAFVKEHKKMLAKTALLKTDEGMIWEAKIVKETSDYFIREGDWPRFVLHHKLELGDMLIFFLIDKSTFQVLLYSKKSLASIRHFEELSSSDDEVENVEEKEDEEEYIEVSGRSKKVKMEAVQLSVDPPGGSKDLGKSDTKAPETKKVNEVKMEPVILSDSEGERIYPSSGSKDGGNPCYSHPGFIMKGVKSHAKADDMLGMKKKAPDTKEEKKVFMELIELSDSEEESVDPSRGSKDWGNPCNSHPGKFDAKADNMLGVKKKALETKEVKKASKDPDKPKKPAGAFFIFLKDFRKQFKEENPKNKSVGVIAGGEKWKQLSDAEKAPYMAQARKWLVDYHRKKDAYNKGVAAGSSKEEESYKSLFEVD